MMSLATPSTSFASPRLRDPARAADELDIKNELDDAAFASAIRAQTAAAAAAVAERAAALRAAAEKKVAERKAWQEAARKKRRERERQNQLDEVVVAERELLARATELKAQAEKKAAREARKAAVQEEAVRHLQREAHLRQALLDAQAIFLSPPPLCTLIFASSLYLTTAGSAAAA